VLLASQIDPSQAFFVTDYIDPIAPTS